VVPVASRATAESDRYVLPRNSNPSSRTFTRIVLPSCSRWMTVPGAGRRGSRAPGARVARAFAGPSVVAPCAGFAAVASAAARSWSAVAISARSHLFVRHLGDEAVGERE
jgi:hypothetical protein